MSYLSNERTETSWINWLLIYHTNLAVIILLLRSDSRKGCAHTHIIYYCLPVLLLKLLNFVTLLLFYALFTGSNNRTHRIQTPLTHLQDATQYDGRPRPGQHCVRCGPSSPSQKGHTPIFGPCLLWPNGRPSQLLLSICLFLVSSLLFCLVASDSARRSLRDFNK